MGRGFEQTPVTPLDPPLRLGRRLIQSITICRMKNQSFDKVPKVENRYMSHCMRFPTKWYVQPTKPHQPAHRHSLIRAFACRLNIL